MTALALAGDIKSNQTEPLQNRLFKISQECFGRESSYTTHFEGFIEPDRLTLHSRQFLRFTMD